MPATHVDESHAYFLIWEIPSWVFLSAVALFFALNAAVIVWALWRRRHQARRAG